VADEGVGRGIDILGYLKEIIFGGKVTIENNFPEQHQIEIPSVTFESGGLPKFILGLFLFFLIPLIMLPSDIGIIPYSYPDDFLNNSKWDQYWHIFSYNLVVVLKTIFSGEAFFPNAPLPIGFFWKTIVTIYIIVLDFISVFLLLKSYKIIKGNYDTYVTSFKNK